VGAYCQIFRRVGRLILNYKHSTLVLSNATRSLDAATLAQDASHSRTGLKPNPLTTLVMKTQTYIPDAHQNMCAALPGILTSFDFLYWQKVDHERNYPGAFLKALTDAGRLTALIPVDYGSSGLGLAKASRIMEDFNLAGGNAGARHGQMYNMVNHETNEFFFNNLEKSAANLMAEEGKGFSYMLDGLNAERALLGSGFTCEYDVERKFRESWLYQVSPISTQLIYSYVTEHLLGLQRSF
jgi:alkylation response protein AidB-like acyl-CoA dehydrogenase